MTIEIAAFGDYPYPSIEPGITGSLTESIRSHMMAYGVVGCQVVVTAKGKESDLQGRVELLENILKTTMLHLESLFPGTTATTMAINIRNAMEGK